MREDIRYEYFEWLINIACGNRFPSSISYRMLLRHLDDVPFRYIIPRDKNRAADGAELRYKFAIVSNYSESVDEILDILERPCSVLEMMIALAINCEEDIMDNPDYGDRTGQWFWNMIVSLGLGSISDSNYDEEFVDEVIDRFLDREYEPDGRGSLFTIRHCDRDLRNVEIWYQLCWYLDTIT